MNIILASNSPRRKQLLAGLGLDFEVRVVEGIDESYPEELPAIDVALYISEKKALAYSETLGDDDVVITADTVVVVGSKVLGKPHDYNEACQMLRDISGRTHQVVTGVCITTRNQQRRLSVVSDVTFKTLLDGEIEYYVEHYRPYDKAGAYGIQEWIGYVGVTSLNGSYFNVMGFPVQRVWQELIDMFGLQALIRDDRARPL